MLQRLLAVYGIETLKWATSRASSASCNDFLPFTALKLLSTTTAVSTSISCNDFLPFTALKRWPPEPFWFPGLLQRLLAVYGIETLRDTSFCIHSRVVATTSCRLRHWNATSSLRTTSFLSCCNDFLPFTALKLADFNRIPYFLDSCNDFLPFTALKLWWNRLRRIIACRCNDFLPFTALKPRDFHHEVLGLFVATTSCRLRHWNYLIFSSLTFKIICCNDFLPFTALKR